MPDSAEIRTDYPEVLDHFDSRSEIAAALGYGEEITLLNNVVITADGAEAVWDIETGDNMPCWLRDHTPDGEPIVPGVMQQEAAMQLGALLAKTKICPDIKLLARESSVTWKAMLFPGDKVHISVSDFDSKARGPMTTFSAKADVRNIGDADHKASRISYKGVIPPQAE